MSEFFGGAIVSQAYQPNIRRSRLDGRPFALGSTFWQVLLALVLGTAQATACPYVDTRICDIDTKLRAYTHGHIVSYEELGAGQIRSKAETEWIPGGTDVIRITDSESYGYDELTFLIAHEFGHSFRKHSRKELEARGTQEDMGLTDTALFAKYGDPDDSPAELYHRQELEADAFAVEFMRFDNKNPLRAMRSVLPNGYGSDTHPSRRARLENAKQVLAGLR